MTTPTFYLGTHQSDWLGWNDRVPMCVSDRRLRARVHGRYAMGQLPIAAGPWVLDSGGFTELSSYGRWQTGPADYADRVRVHQRRIGRLVWAAPQDWMCEPQIRERTGLTVVEHQRRTTDNLLQLLELDPSLPWIPVLQGWQDPDDYLRHVEAYEAAGVDLAAFPAVGVGSVCRLQADDVAGAIFTALDAAGVRRLHGFGLKVRGLARWGHLLASADSMAWSLDARRRPPLPGCIGHRSCANCPRYAMQWRDRILHQLNHPPRVDR